MKSKKGYVYLIQAGGHDCKIGYSSDLHRRVKKLAQELPWQMELLDYFQSDNCPAVERAIHKRFAEYRLNGEWFDFSDINLGWVRRVMEFMVDSPNSGGRQHPPLSADEGNERVQRLIEQGMRPEMAAAEVMNRMKGQR